MFVVCTALSALTHQGSKIYEVKVEPAESLFTQQVTDQSEG